MALLPVFRAIANNNAAATTSCVGNKPAGTSDGDLLVACICVNGANAITAAPSGWTQATNQQTGLSVSTWIYYKIASSEPASWTWTIGAASGYQCSVLAYSQAKQTSPLDSIQGSNGAGNFTSQAPGAATAATKNEIGVVCSAVNNSPAQTLSGAGWTARLASTSAQSMTFLIAELSATASGSQVSPNFSWTGGQNCDVSSAFFFGGADIPAALFFGSL